MNRHRHRLLLTLYASRTAVTRLRARPARSSSRPLARAFLAGTEGLLPGGSRMGAPHDRGRLCQAPGRSGRTDMLWYCRFTWHPHTTPAQVRQRVLQQHEAGLTHPDRIRGWYNLAGGGAGFMLIETDDPRELTTMLQPYMDLVRWDVHAA